MSLSPGQIEWHSLLGVLPRNSDNLVNEQSHIRSSDIIPRSWTNHGLLCTRLGNARVYTREDPTIYRPREGSPWGI